jgi:hypothetical protein
MYEIFTELKEFPDENRPPPALKDTREWFEVES